MSTRCNIIIKDGHDQLWFYRHSDGYPSGALPTLKKFMQWVKDRRIRDNVSQAAGWLIIIGHQEYRPTAEGNKEHYEAPQFVPGGESSLSDWKVGAYEPTICQHGDIEYLYTLDLTKPNEIKVKTISTGRTKTVKV